MQNQVEDRIKNQFESENHNYYKYQIKWKIKSLSKNQTRAH